MVTVGDGEQLGGKPAPLQTTYKTEFEWAIGEVVADIAETAATSRGSRPATPTGLKPWNPGTFVAFATAAFGSSAAKDATGGLADQYGPLADLTAAAIVAANDAVSSALRKDLRSARAHESAALVLAAFGLREAAEDLTDVRWTLNRMTAHLAMAEALRAGQSESVDGQLATVAFYGLANRTATALRLLDEIPDRAGDARLAAWKRALRLRLTHDWRIATASVKAFRIEKLEYFRARRKTLRGPRAGQDLSDMAEPAAADFTRIIQTFPYGVEDGNDFVSDALRGELRELAEVYRAMHRRELPPTLPAEIINARPARLMQNQPQVLPWGAWAEFFQRHIGMYVGQIDDFQRKMLSAPHSADRTKAVLDAGLRHLTLFPIASARRTRGRGTEADLSYINQAVDLAARAPELVNYDYWSFLDMGARYEVVRMGMPERLPWFAPPSAEVPYDAGVRVRELGGALTTPDLEALVTEASSDVSLASRALGPRPQNQKLIAHLVAWLKGRSAYDLWAVEAAVNWARTLSEQIEWQRHGCALAIDECLDLADLLARAGDEKGAVTEYERAFRDPALDVVAFAHSAAWLVAYYERADRMPRAYDLAQRAAATGSARGIVTLARLYERRNRVEEAALLFERLSNRYERSSDELAGFLYRQAMIGRKIGYLDRWRAVEKRLFPHGLRPLPAAMTEQPAGGVFVYEDSNTTRRVRLQAGDIIVGVDGWLVENKGQYDAVMAFGDPNAMHKVTAWRGILFTVDLPENNGADLQTHPLKGWIQ